MNRSPVIHVLYACTDYEGDTAVRAFADKTQADALLAKVEAHMAKKPTPPNAVLDTPENDAEFDRYWAAYERWSKRHPAGQQFATNDSFTVQPLPFTP